MRRKLLLRSSSSTTSMWLSSDFYIIDHFHLCSHVFGTPSDLGDIKGEQNASADDQVEDEYKTIR